MLCASKSINTSSALAFRLKMNTVKDSVALGKIERAVKGFLGSKEEKSKTSNKENEINDPEVYERKVREVLDKGGFI